MKQKYFDVHFGQKQLKSFVPVRRGYLPRWGIVHTEQCILVLLFCREPLGINIGR